MTPTNDPVSVAQNIAPNPTVTISWEWHRGAKWSKEHNVEPCTSGFGICNLEVSREGNPQADATLYLETIDPNTGKGNMIIKFLNDPNPSTTDNLLIVEDNLSMISSFCYDMGYTSITLLAGDYTFVPGDIASADNPYGYAIVDVICVP